MDSEGETRSTYRIRVDKPLGNQPFGRSRRRWKGGTKMAVREIGSGG
jgi:hypothetical protein